MDTMLVSSLRVNASMNSNATLVKPVFTASSLIGGPVLVGGVEFTGLARGPAFQLFNPAGVLHTTQFALNPDFRTDLSFVLGNFDADGGRTKC